MPHPRLAEAGVILRAFVPPHFNVQRQAVTKHPADIPTFMRVGWAHAARAWVTKPFIRVESDVDNFPCGFLHEGFGGGPLEVLEVNGKPKRYTETFQTACEIIDKPVVFAALPGTVAPLCRHGRAPGYSRGWGLGIVGGAVVGASVQSCS